MDCPGFQILHYGIYDSRVAAARQARSQERLVNRFELELITEDIGGRAYIDGREFLLKKGLFLCGKPGQHRYSLLPTRCYYVHLQTEDAALLALLEGLPDACPLSDFPRWSRCSWSWRPCPFPGIWPAACRCRAW